MDGGAVIFLILYLVGAGTSYPFFVYKLVKEVSYGEIETFDIVFGMLLGLFIAAVWFITLPGYGIARGVKWAMDGGSLRPLADRIKGRSHAR